jgi:hypothetical protein
MPSAEAYEAAARAMFVFAEEHGQTDRSVWLQIQEGSRDYWREFASHAVDAVWDLAVAEGRRQAAEAIRATMHAGVWMPRDITGRSPNGGRPTVGAYGEWAARIAAGETP